MSESSSRRALDRSGFVGSRSFLPSRIMTGFAPLEEAGEAGAPASPDRYQRLPETGVAGTGMLLSVFDTITGT